MDNILLQLIDDIELLLKQDKRFLNSNDHLFKNKINNLNYVKPVDITPFLNLAQLNTKYFQKKEVQKKDVPIQDVPIQDIPLINEDVQKKDVQKKDVPIQYIPLINDDVQKKDVPIQDIPLINEDVPKHCEPYDLSSLENIVSKLKQLNVTVYKILNT
jgi:hypothetical protein